MLPKDKKPESKSQPSNDPLIEVVMYARKRSQTFSHKAPNEEPRIPRPQVTDAISTKVQLQAHKGGDHTQRNQPSYQDQHKPRAITRNNQDGAECLTSFSTDLQ